jgi:hypothetical protein
MAAERQLEGDMHSFVAKMGTQTCLHIQEEELLERKDEDGEGEEGLEQRWCFPESGPTVGWINHLD